MEVVANASGVDLGYKQEAILHTLSFTINKGDFVFLTGNSGSGKTTLIKSLYGAIKPKCGNLSVCGVNIQKAGRYKINSLRKKLGLIFQDYKLISEWNIEKNVMLPLLIAGYPRSVCEKQTAKLLIHMKLTHKAHLLPRELSGGEQQRAAVARALVHSPHLIIADEPTGNLDEFSAEVVLNLFKTANSCGITTIIATHHVPKQFDIDHRHFHIEGKGIKEILT